MGFITGCSEGDSPSGNDPALQPADLLPASGEISGWDKGSGAGDYGEADDQASLYALINGAAELFIQHGFEEGVKQNYFGSVGGAQTSLELFISGHGAAANVAALFEEDQIVPPGLTPWEMGDEAAIDESLPFHLAIHLRQGPFYTRVTIERGSDDTAALIVAQDFAAAVAQEIP
ncbi:MAG: hypothetical protein C4524_05555 [Candidatus Zixiibacteriota bacterium]|nr:MAG: hypothetical protein C4524_05555 [candidate division Zixibacteria bacterium]